MNREISIGSAISAKITGKTTLADLIHAIQTGKWAKQIAALRAATGDDAKRLKKKLPAVLPSGIFSLRANDGLMEHIGWLCADIDKVPERVAELHAIARKDPHAAAAFVSPSGTGLKIFFCVPADASRHAQSFAAVRAHVAKLYGAKVDESRKDVAGLCFVSHDPAAFYNPEANPLMVEIQISGDFQQDHKAHKVLEIPPTPTTLRLNPESCIATSLHDCIPASLHNNGNWILENLKAKADAKKALAVKQPKLAELYHGFIERRFEAIIHGRNKFIVQAVPFLYRAVAPQFVLELVGCFYDCNRALLNDPREQHMKEAKAMLESVAKTYLGQLGAYERQIYDALPDRERDAFRICRDLALLPVLAVQPREPLTFFLSCNQLGDRLGIYPMQAQRILRQFASIGLVVLLKQGTRRAKGVRGDAGEYKWALQPCK